MQSFIENVTDLAASLASYWAAKMIGSVLLAILAYAVGESHVQLLGTLTVLVLIDFVTGLYCAYKTSCPIESRKMVRTAIKWTLYMLMISAAHLTETLIPIDSYLATVTIGFLGATELVSILENIGKTGVAIPLKLLNRLRSYSSEN